MPRPVEFNPEWIDTIATVPSAADIDAQLRALASIRRWVESVPESADSDDGEE